MEARAGTIDGCDDLASWTLDEIDHDGAAGWALVQRDWSERASLARCGARGWTRLLAILFAALGRLVRGCARWRRSGGDDVERDMTPHQE